MSKSSRLPAKNTHKQEREELYQALLIQQEGCCKICKKHVSKFKKRLCMDHNHQTMEYRGLLCGYCNRYLVGRFRDPDLVQRIADYLRTGHTGVFMPPKKRRKRKRR